MIAIICFFSILWKERKFENFRKNYIIFLIPIILTLVFYYLTINKLPQSLNEVYIISLSEKLFFLLLVFFYYLLFLCGSILLFRMLSFPRVFHGAIWLTCKIIEFWYSKLQLRKQKNKIIVLPSSIITKNKGYVFLYFTFELLLLYFAISLIFFSYSSYKISFEDVMPYLENLFRNPMHAFFLIFLVIISPLFCLYFAGFHFGDNNLGPSIFHKLQLFSGFLFLIWLILNHKLNFDFGYLNSFYIIEILWIALGFTLEIDNATTKTHKYLKSNISKYRDCLEIKYNN